MKLSSQSSLKLQQDSKHSIVRGYFSQSFLNSVIQNGRQFLYVC